MASTWGDSWGVSWGISWDISEEVEVIIVGGGRWNGKWNKELLEYNAKKDKPEFPYDHRFPDEREKQIKQSATILARSGGYARAKNLTPSQRTNIARNAAKARWK